MGHVAVAKLGVSTSNAVSHLSSALVNEVSVLKAHEKTIPNM